MKIMNVPFTKTEKVLLGIIIVSVLLLVAGVVFQLELLLGAGIVVLLLLGFVVMVDFDPIVGDSIPIFDRAEIKHKKLWIMLFYLGVLVTFFSYMAY